MEDFIYNPWIITIFGAVVAGLILHIIIFIFWKSKTKPTHIKRFGIVNHGKNSQFHNNTFVGMLELKTMARTRKPKIINSYKPLVVYT